MEDNYYYELVLFRNRSEHYRLKCLAMEKKLKYLRNQIKRKNSKFAKLRQRHETELSILNAQIDVLEERFKKIRI